MSQTITRQDIERRLEKMKTKTLDTLHALHVHPDAETPTFASEIKLLEETLNEIEMLQKMLSYGSFMVPDDADDFRGFDMVISPLEKALEMEGVETA